MMVRRHNNMLHRRARPAVMAVTKRAMDPKDHHARFPRIHGAPDQDSPATLGVDQNTIMAAFQRAQSRPGGRYDRPYPGYASSKQRDKGMHKTGGCAIIAQRQGHA
jgi:hypothetical protein